MTLQQFIDKYNGKKVGDGQCGTLVRQYWIEVDQTNPPSYPNSKDYWSNPVPGYDKVTSNPQPGDIAIYNGHGIYTEGHSAIYDSGQVFEQNADPDGSAAHLFNRANTYLLGYLRKRGVNNVTTQEQHDVGTGAYRTGLHREPESYDAAVNLGKKFESNGKLTANSVIAGLNSIRNGSEWKEQDAKIRKG